MLISVLLVLISRQSDFASAFDSFALQVMIDSKSAK